MSQDSAPKTYNPLAKAFHWIVLALLIGQFVTIFIGQIALKSGEDYLPLALTSIAWHKTFGLVVFLVAGARLIWRQIGGLPEWAPGLADWEKSAAHSVENWLYRLLFFVPVSGLAYSITSGHPTAFFGVFEVPAFAERSIWMSNVSYMLHILSLYVFVGVFALHLGMVLRRSVFEKDRFIARMLPGKP
ncbi:MAG: cytochrome b [Pseudomonadota bacterium]